MPAGRSRQDLGLRGENVACAALAARGYEILARRYRTRLGEIDIVARVAGTIVFVEVKTRAGARFGGGGEAVTAWKRRRMAVVAADYLSRHRLHGTPCRFDVVVVDAAAARPVVEVYENAFAAQG